MRCAQEPLSLIPHPSLPPFIHHSHLYPSPTPPTYPIHRHTSPPLHTLPTLAVSALRMSLAMRSPLWISARMPAAWNCLRGATGTATLASKAPQQQNLMRIATPLKSLLIHPTHPTPTLFPTVGTPPLPRPPPPHYAPPTPTPVPR